MHGDPSIRSSVFGLLSDFDIRISDFMGESVFNHSNHVQAGNPLRIPTHGSWLETSTIPGSGALAGARIARNTSRSRNGLYSPWTSPFGISAISRAAGVSGD